MLTCKDWSRVVFRIALWAVVVGGPAFLLAANEPADEKAAPAPTWQESFSLEGEEVPNLGTLSPDGKFMAMPGGGTTVRIFDLDTPKMLANWNDGGSHPAYSPDGKLLACNGCSSPKDGDSLVRVIEAGTGKRVFAAGKTVDRNWTQNIQNVRFSSDGKRVATATAPTRARPNVSSLFIWEVPSGKLLTQLDMKCGPRPPFCPHLSPDFKTAACFDAQDDSVKVWDVARNAPVWTIPVKLGDDWHIDFSPDGKLLALSGRKPTPRGAGLKFEENPSCPIQVWNLATRKLISTYSHKGYHGSRMQSNGAPWWAWSADNQILAIAEDSEVILWDHANEKVEAKLPLPKDYTRVSGIAFSCDGKRLIVAGQQVGNGRPVSILRVYEKAPAAQAAGAKEKAQPAAAK